MCDVQELLQALDKARTALQQREEQLREGEHRTQVEKEDRDKTIQELKICLEAKAQQLEVRHSNIHCQYEATQSNGSV